MRMPYSWPYGYGFITAILMVLLIVVIALPIAFALIWKECGFKEAYRCLVEGP